MKEKQYTESKELIYNLMNGTYDLDRYPVPASQIVENEFEEGKTCADCYRKVFDANQRLCERLGTGEDSDIECIINNMYDIAHVLCLKMFDYGVRWKELEKYIV